MASLLKIFQGEPLIEMTLDGIETREHAIFQDNQQGTLKLPVYIGDDDISGVVIVRMNNQKQIKHFGIQVELIGHVDILNDQKQSSDFMSISRELEPQGLLFEDKEYKFQFQNFEKQYESYYGNKVKLRYYVKVYMTRWYDKVQKEVDFAVLILEPEEDQPKATNMEVGIEDILHINFEYSKNRFHQRDVLTGNINICLVEIKIKYMELVITRKEQYLQGSQFETDNKSIIKYQLVDGCPQKGDVIPVRLYLSGLDLIPSVRNFNGKFCVKNMMSLIIVDEDDKRYFQSQIITIYRKK